MSLIFASQANAGTVMSDGEDIIINTKGGFEARTADGDYSFKIGQNPAVPALHSHKLRLMYRHECGSLSFVFSVLSSYQKSR